MRSQNGAPTSVTFVNKSGLHRALDWIDFDGRATSFGGLNPGESKTLDSFIGHPWVIATGPGNCLQIFVLQESPSTMIDLLRVAGDGPAGQAQTPRVQPSVPTPVVVPQRQCGNNYVLRNGACVLLQNCGQNAFRNAERDCECRKHFSMRNGRCVAAHTTCSSNQVYSSSLAKCIAIADTCSQGQVYNANTRKCVTVKQPVKECPKGQHLTQNGNCVHNQLVKTCPKGQHLSKNGNCIANQ